MQIEEKEKHLGVDFVLPSLFHREKDGKRISISEKNFTAGLQQLPSPWAKELIVKAWKYQTACDGQRDL